MTKYLEAAQVNVDTVWRKQSIEAYNAYMIASKRQSDLVHKATFEAAINATLETLKALLPKLIRDTQPVIAEEERLYNDLSEEEMLTFKS